MQAGLVPEISVFPTGISVSGLKILPYAEHHGYWNQSEMNSGGPDVVVLHGLLCFPRHTHPFNRSDTALRVAEAMVARKL